MLQRRSFILNCLHNSTCTSLVKRVQQIHIIVTDIKIKHIGIGGDSVGVISLGQRHPFLLQGIANQDLLCRLFVFLRNFNESRVVGFVVAYDGGVCFDDDAILLAVCIDCPLLAPRVELERCQYK